MPLVNFSVQGGRPCASNMLYFFLIFFFTFTCIPVFPVFCESEVKIKAEEEELITARAIT